MSALLDSSGSARDLVQMDLLSWSPEPREPRPVVKWVGGKTKLLPELLARMPPSFERYYEPFAGGAALFFRVAPTRAAGSVVLGDANADLIAMYRAVADDVESVIARLWSHSVQHSEQHFAYVRGAWNRNSMHDGPIDRAAAFIYLNKTCFNGLWRVNRAGELNSPWGKHATFVPDHGALRLASSVLQRADLRASGYRETMRDVGPSDFAFMDPPYVPASATANFTSYTADAFGPEQQRELADTALKLVKRGCRVMLSNSDTPYVRELYSDFRIDSVKCSRAINSKSSGRGAVGEVIIIGGYEPEAA